MGFFDRFIGTEDLRSLPSIKRRAKVGAKITLLALNYRSKDQPVQDELIGVPRTIRSTNEDHVRLDPYGAGGERRALLFWPDLPREGFLGMIASPHGVLAGFVDDNTFIVEDFVTYAVYRLDQ